MDYKAFRKSIMETANVIKKELEPSSKLNLHEVQKYVSDMLNKGTELHKEMLFAVVNLSNSKPGYVPYQYYLNPGSAYKPTTGIYDKKNLSDNNPAASEYEFTYNDKKISPLNPLNYQPFSSPFSPLQSYEESVYRYVKLESLIELYLELMDEIINKYHSTINESIDFYNRDMLLSFLDWFDRYLK